jgi:hypothetical protein
VTQRKRLYKTDRDIQRGVLAGFSSKNVSLTGYALNPDDAKVTVVLAVAVTLEILLRGRRLARKRAAMATKNSPRLNRQICCSAQTATCSCFRAAGWRLQSPVAMTAFTRPDEIAFTSSP